MEKPHPIRMGQILIGLYQRSSPPRTSAHMTIAATTIAMTIIDAS